MKKLYGSFGAKLLAVILLCLMVIAFFASAICASTVYDRGGYGGAYEQSLRQALGNRASGTLLSIGQEYLAGVDPEQLRPAHSNLRFTILDTEGNELYSDYHGERVLWSDQVTVFPDYGLNVFPRISGEEGPVEFDSAFAVGTPEPQPTVVVTPTPRPAEPPAETAPQSSEIFQVTLYRSGEVLSFEGSKAFETWRKQWQQENTVTVKGCVLADLSVRDEFSRTAELYSMLYSLRYPSLWAMGLSFLLGVLLYVFLLRAAGHRDDSGTVTASFPEKIPFDLFTLLILAAVGVCLTFLCNIDLDYDVPGITVATLVGLGIGLLFLLWSVSLAVRVKRGELLKSCLSVRFLRWCSRILENLWAGLKTLCRSLPILWKWALGIGGLALIDFVWRINNRMSGERTAIGWFLFWLLAGGATFYAVLAFRRLRLGTKAIAGGDLNAQVDEKYLVGDLKDHARDLNHIRDGISSAVEERMRSERLRTELITNVSHDIKTPLTSIINYTDLIAKEEPESKTIREYVEVLSRQSARLKKLIEDLIEASKASSGSLPVSPEIVELGVLLDQAAGEYAERFQAAGLEPVLRKCPQPLTIWADGRHMWRVLDNLLNNIVKYALPGTRVYLDLDRDGKRAVIMLRNISRESLAKDPAELTERFVRGDESRSGEGSGLGLSIAMSLVKLQGGTMNLSLDGDLFKVVLRFPIQTES